MPRANYSYFKDGLTVGGMGLNVYNKGKTFYVCNSTVSAPLGLAGSDNNKGTTPEHPLATIDAAIGKCTANRGDVIVVLPGHAETVSAAGGITMDVAGVTIVGVGEGDLRPTISFATSTDASIAVTGVDCAITGSWIFKCNIASQVHMFDIAADDFRIDGGQGKDILFTEGTATGLSFITADTADGDSDNLTLRGFRMYCPTAGNYDGGVVLGKDHVGVRIEDFDIYGDFDDAGINLPAGGNACLDLCIRNGRSVNLQSGQYGIKINGTTCTGEISDVRLGTDAQATALDNGSLRTYNVQWSSTTDQVQSIDVLSNSGEKAGTTFTVVKSFTSSSIPNNTQTGGALTGASSGTLVLEQIILQTDGTGVAGPTNVEISTDNTKGLTGAGGPSALVAVSGLGANKTIVVGYGAANENLPLYLESGKKLYIHGDDAAGTGAGVVDVIMIYRRVSDNATIAAA